MIEQSKYSDGLEAYKAERYDQIKIYVAKGARAIVKDLAAAEGRSVSDYIRELIQADAKKRGIDVSAAFFAGGGYIDALRLTAALDGQQLAPWT
jgi:hypothetical protein